MNEEKSLSENIFVDIGKKIKTLAKILCWTGIVGFGITGFIIFIIAANTFYGGEVFVGLGFAILIIGPLTSWVGSFFIYGFGELVDNSNVIKENLLKSQIIPNDAYEQKEYKKERTSLANNIHSENAEGISKVNNCLKVAIPEIVSLPAKQNSKRCLTCSRLLPFEQQTCVCGSDKFEMRMVEENSDSGNENIEENGLKICCPQCKTDLEFMCYTEDDFKKEQNCPFCNAELIYKE